MSRSILSKRRSREDKERVDKGHASVRGQSECVIIVRKEKLGGQSMNVIVKFAETQSYFWKTDRW